MKHFLYFRDGEILCGGGGAEPRGWDGRTDVRRARVLSLFQADVPPSRAASSGPTWLSWGSSDPHALTPRSALASRPCLHRAPAVLSPSLSQAPQIKLNRTNRGGLAPSFSQRSCLASGRRGGDDGGRAAEIGLRTLRRRRAAGRELLHTAAAWKQALWL